ncbi:MAG: transglycosylase domain-containing protein [Hyphomonadaceae bacterium]
MDEERRGMDFSKLRERIMQDHIGALLKGRSRLTLGAAAGIGALAALAMVIAAWFWIYWGLPRVPDAAALWALNRQPGITFLDQRGREIGVRGAYYGRRLALSDMPGYLPKAFLAIEDRRFYEHAGVDRMAVMRALWANLTAGHTVQGASTISQQLARNLFLTPAQTVNRKLREMVLASRIEHRLTKDEILELYLNRVYLGDQAFGVDAAAHRFFGKDVSELSLGEAAMLAGLPKAPSRSAPTESLARATARQHVVLDAMADARYITQAQADAAKAQRIRVVPREGEGSLGYVFDLATSQARNLTPERTDDLVIHLTIDADIQSAAAAAVRRRLGNRAFGRHPLQAAMVIIDRGGAARALIGGTNYNASKFNRATQAERQPGSAFKAFVYAAALERGFDPEDVRYDEPVVIQGWRPQNYENDYRGAVTLRTALALSINTVAAEVTDEVGPQNVSAVARRLGVRTMPAAGQFVPASIALGTLGATVWDMTQAYAAFMREGQAVDAYLIEKIENASGETLYTRPAPQPRPPAYDPELAHTMTSMLGAVVLRGTGAHARLGDRDVAGKTGTSQDYRDAWFIGYTADYAGGVWVGFDDHAPMGRVTGGSLPADIWADAMRAAHRNVANHPLIGIEQPVRTPREIELSGFFRSLADAFSGGDIIDDLKPANSDFEYR